MSDPTVEYAKVIDLCRTAARAVVDALVRMGARPSVGPAAVLWDKEEKRLQAQLSSLTDMITSLSATAVLVSLQDANAQNAVLTLEKVTTEAKAAIKRIKKISSLLMTGARVLDLGLALLGLAAAPSVATGTAVVKAATALARDLDSEKEDGSEDD
jgi:hypothetical protein